MLFEKFASHIHINDLNKSIYAFWCAVLHQTEELCRLIQDTAVTMEEWHRQKAVQGDGDAEPIHLAFSTFFLNRTKHSGIGNAGVIGGKGQGGQWKLDARYNKAGLIYRIQRVAGYREQITLTRLDAAEYIRMTLPTLPAGMLLYLDPPYYVKGEGLYEHFYQHRDHAEIAALIQDAPQRWVVSYDAVPEVRALYPGFNSIEYTLSYSAAVRQRGLEAMFFSHNLQMPPVETPAGIKSAIVRARQTQLTQTALVLNQ